MQVVRIVFIWICLCSFTLVHADKIDKPTWEKIADDYDYDPPKKFKKPPEKKKEKANKPPRDLPKPKGLPAGAAYILYGILGVAFIALIVAIIKNAGPRNKKVDLRQTYDEENPDELVLTELERELNNAANKGNYNRCLRYHFLLILERLETNGVITWHKFKTNGEYLNEAINIPQHKRLRQLTMVYEYYWYGEHILDKNDYEKLEKHFVQMRKELGDE